MCADWKCHESRYEFQNPFDWTKEHSCLLGKKQRAEAPKRLFYLRIEYLVGLDIHMYVVRRGAGLCCCSNPMEIQLKSTGGFQIG